MSGTAVPLCSPEMMIMNFWTLESGDRSEGSGWKIWMQLTRQTVRRWTGLMRTQESEKASDESDDYEILVYRAK